MTGTFRGARQTSRLRSTDDATAYQRRWFADLQRHSAQGGPFALINADAPQELFRAMDIPYVVNQWWASVLAAKQKTGTYAAHLRERGYPDRSEPYTSLALGSLFDRDPAGAPWGGLPTPSIVVADLATDATRKIFDVWAHETGATFFAFEKSVAPDPDPGARWWERMPHDYERLVGSERIDLMTAELGELRLYLEQLTGRPLDEARLREVLDLVNEQQEYFKLTRDLIARTVPAPVGITDTIPATMIPQWHRGTEWARDAARSLYDEVSALAAAGVAAWPRERIRLMWLGRGLWFHLGFYQQMQERYDAVFVWSMYLAIAADGYVRHRVDDAPLRSIAGRYAAFSEQLHMPGWASGWHVKEALQHRVDGVIQLDAGGRSSQVALERAGIPVLALDASNIDPRDWDEARFDRQVAEFIEGRVVPIAARRRQA